jgi:hypothetical protein
MLRSRSLLPIASLLVILASSACSGEAGPTGPTGPQGPEGPQGPGGAQGPAGTANVIYSDWFVPPSWTSSTVFSRTVFRHDEPAPGITQAILDSGVVLVYGRLNGYVSAIWPTNQVSQLPITIQYESGGSQIDVWSANLRPDTLRITMTNNVDTYSSISTSHGFRYVIVPGGAPQSAPPGAVRADMSYEQMRALYGVPENGSSMP